MRGTRQIITVGLCPCWDTVVRVNGVEWGEHRQVAGVESYPAGKALNISRALDWMGEKNVAAGLWGKNDFGQMAAELETLGKVEIKFTAAAGKTRENITVIDEKHGREMHLRAPSELATRNSLRQLAKDLKQIVTPESVCVFAGAMPPDEFLDDVLSIIRQCRQRGAEVAVDTSGRAYRKIVEQGNLLVIKPNVEELRELTGKKIADTAEELIKAARTLLDRVRIVVVSRGGKGAVAVSKDKIVEARCSRKRKVVTTVCCGDYLLAGFLAGLTQKNDMKFALETAIKSATARAWGWTGMNWSKVLKFVEVQMKMI